MAQLNVLPTGDEVVAVQPRRPPVGNIRSWIYDQEIFSTVILSFPLI